jgi:hypothetical protein
MFHDTKFQRFNALSGATSMSSQLSNIRGYVDSLIFIVRLDTQLTGDNQLIFQEIGSWNLLGGNQASIVGGQTIQSLFSIQQLNKDWVLSSYLADALTISTLSPFVYMWCWNPRIAYSLATGEPGGCYNFQGTEVININFRVALPSSATIDVYCTNHCALLQSQAGYKKTETF